MDFDQGKYLRLVGKRLLGVLVLASVLGGACFVGLGPAQAAPAKKAEIIFSNAGDIVSIKADGSGRESLAEGYGPRISPDGRKMLFYRRGRARGSTELVVSMRNVNKGRVVLRAGRRTSMGRFNYSGMKSPVWSVSDGRIYVILQGSLPRKGKRVRAERVISMERDGSKKQTVMTRIHRPNDYGEPLVNLDVSPDGNRLLLGENRFRNWGSPLVVHDLRTGRSEVLRQETDGARWSPDGRRILFESSHEDLNTWCDDGEVCHPDTKLYIMNADGSKVRRVTSRRPGSEFDAEWSPDGSRIVFASDRNNRLGPDTGYADYHGSEIYSIRPNGKCLTWLTNGSPSSVAPVFGPESRLDFSPGDCGATSRTPIQLRRQPSPWRVKGGGRSTLPRLWLGPVHDSMLYTYDYGPNSELMYEDCALFTRSSCGESIVIQAQRLCYRDSYDYDRYMVRSGSFESLIELRGVLIMKSVPSEEDYENGFFQTLVMTGAQIVDLRQDGWAPGASLEQTLGWVDGLRPVGDASAERPLEPPLFDQGLVDAAATRAAAFEATGSIAEVAEQFDSTPEIIRSYVRFHDELERVGPVQTIDCTKPKDENP